MSHVITIGKSDAGPVKIDLLRLADSRALIQANSGGGKSYLLRGITEQAAGKIQTIILDPEGEFATLREKADLLLVGSEGEIKPSVRAAPLLARKLAELNVSAVIDLYDFRMDERREFVRQFCESLLDLPKSSYHPMLIAIDEAHLFCPETNAGQSVATGAVIGLASQGRKRGIGLIALTQRLSKLHKDCAAELNTVFIGRTWLPNDQKRCGDILGIGKEGWAAMRDLDPGEFSAFGPALVGVNGVIKLKAAQVKTTHPKAGERHKMTPPAASKVIINVAAELADLPQQAEAEIRDLAAAKAKIGELERAARQLQRDAGSTPASRELQQQVKESAALIVALRKGLAEAMKVIAEITSKGFEGAGVDPDQIKKAVEAATDQIVKLVERKMIDKQAEFDRLKKEAAKVLASLQKLLGEDVTVKVDVQHNKPFTVTPSPARHKPEAVVDVAGREALTPTEKAVLDAAASFPGGATRQRISIFSGRSIKSSSFNGAFSGGEGNGKQLSLVQQGLLRQDGDRYVPTDAGAALAMPTVGTSLADWLRKLTPSEAKVLECIARAEKRLTREEVSERTGQSTLSSSFNGAFPTLRELGLIEGRNDFAATAELAETVEA